MSCSLGTQRAALHWFGSWLLAGPAAPGVAPMGAVCTTGCCRQKVGASIPAGIGGAADQWRYWRCAGSAAVAAVSQLVILSL